MTVMAVEVSREQAFEEWLNALRSGDFQQGRESLCRMEGDTKAYCCIGVLNEVVFGTTWREEYPGADSLVDENGNLYNIPSESEKAKKLGLDTRLTEEEVEILSDYTDGWLSTEDSRLAALANMNDSGNDFDTIAMVIEDVLGWRYN